MQPKAFYLHQGKHIHKKKDKNIQKEWNPKQAQSGPQISNRGWYCISNINQPLTICQQMLKMWCNHLFLFCYVVKTIGAFIVYSLSFNLADLYWPQEQSTSIRYLWYSTAFTNKFLLFNLTSVNWRKSASHSHHSFVIKNTSVGELTNKNKSQNAVAGVLFSEQLSLR